jgi:type IV fimbrial biogenesis protein FimT
VPSFDEVIRSNRTAGQTNDLLVTLAMARSEATKRGMPVSVCAAATPAQTACAAANASNWNSGWIVFLDRTGTPGAMDTAEDKIIQVSHPVRGGVQVTSGTTGFVRFGPSGVPTPTPGADQLLQVKHDRCSGDGRRRISINRFTGRVSLAKVACT